MQQLALAVHALKKEFPLLEEFHDDLISNGDRSLRSTFIDQDLPYILYKGLGAEDALLQQ